MKMRLMSRLLICSVFLLSLGPISLAQKQDWHQASDAELASLLPARAPVDR